MTRVNRKKNLKSGPKRLSFLDELQPILIVTEGKKTEKEYFDNLIQRLDVSGSIDVIEKSKSAPTRVVEKAKESIDKKEDYEIIYCVFDKDNHKDYDRALEMITSIDGTNSIEVHAITSVPCFEYWLYLHSAYTDGPYSSAKEIRNNLEQIPKFKDYDKSIQGALFEYLFKYRLKAKNNAIRALKAARQHQRAPKEHHENPSTRVHIVLEKLEHYHAMKQAQ